MYAADKFVDFIFFKDAGINMKRIILSVFLIFIFLMSFSFTSYGVTAEEDYSIVWDSVNGQTKEYLEDMGIDEISFNDIFNLSPTRVIEFLLKSIKTSGTGVLKSVTLIVVIFIITSIAASFLKESDKNINILYFVCTLTVMTAVIAPVSRILTDAVAGIRTSSIFVNSYLPIMTGIIIASKNPSLAFTYNSFTVFISSFISTFADRFFMPVISALLSFSVLSSFSFEGYRERILKTVRKSVVIILSLFSTVFTGLLTTQSILASSSDSVVLKGIRFISGTFVPIVGNGVGDAISSVFSSFLIMRNTLGVFVIIVILLINLPAMVELLVWYFALEICSIVSTMFDLNHMSDVIDSLASVISLINTVLFFVTFVLTISTGVIIIMGK